MQSFLVAQMYNIPEDEFKKRQDSGFVKQKKDLSIPLKQMNSSPESYRLGLSPENEDNLRKSFLQTDSFPWSNDSAVQYPVAFSVFKKKKDSEVKPMSKPEEKDTFPSPVDKIFTDNDSGYSYPPSNNVAKPDSRQVKQVQKPSKSIIRPVGKIPWMVTWSLSPETEKKIRQGKQPTRTADRGYGLLQPKYPKRLGNVMDKGYGFQKPGYKRYLKDPEGADETDWAPSVIQERALRKSALIV